ncbi:hypothetical protein B0T17DRAFT_491059 [Bombardia bombarda]|uniref:Fork-head domain-containing protein n=1 Tax=Bombardia bombarda TaxID=252184 RepID=A0AA39XB61_9PEZI|nr:hypothetical protein B0T17DRAFT_491059 [Bombardia bombarda]
MPEQSCFGASEPVQIFHDDFYPQPTSMISHAPMPLAAKPPQQPLQPSNPNVVLNPPNTASIQKSPFKPNQRTMDAPLTPLKSSAQGNTFNLVPMMPPNTLQHSTDSLEKKQPMMSRFKPVAQKPTTDMNLQQYMGKENSHHAPIFPAPPQLNIPPENYDQNPSRKRVLSEAAPIEKPSPAKKRRVDKPLPPQDAFQVDEPFIPPQGEVYIPVICDNGLKPTYTYRDLCWFAIIKSPQRKLRLCRIYDWITKTFLFYRKLATRDWRNGIRHNLSTCLLLMHEPKPAGETGGGDDWFIVPGYEGCFLDRNLYRKAKLHFRRQIEMQEAEAKRLEQQAQMPVIHEPMLPAQPLMNHVSLPTLPPSLQSAPSTLPPEISSDATIPVSDIAAPDEMLERANENELLNEADQYSPHPAMMHSSPPIPKRMESHRSDTPPQQQRLRDSSATKSRNHRRKFTGVNDSGYISSLESSAMRPSRNPKLLTSEADRPRRKKGRAEEEIRRLRHSSNDSPSKGRSYGYPQPSSSPLRQASQNASGQMLPPLTPATELKAPPMPPPSVSPSTNLRMHRESVQSMVDSPYRRVAALLPESDLALNLTPGYNMDDLFNRFDGKMDDGTTETDISQNTQDIPPRSVIPLSPANLLPQNGSPIKRSTRKQRMDRSLSTSALNEVKNLTPHNAASSASFLKVPGQTFNFSFDTPSKAFDGLPPSSPSKLILQSPCKMPPLMNDENVAPWLSSDDLDTPDFLEDDDFAGIDMLAGFEKIGSANNTHASRASKSSQKPNLSHACWNA